jgi:hypothetical protein
VKKDAIAKSLTASKSTVNAIIPESSVHKPVSASLAKTAISKRMMKAKTRIKK